MTKETLINSPKALEEISLMSEEELEDALNKRFAMKPRVGLDFPSKLLLIAWLQRAPEEARAWVWDRVIKKYRELHPSRIQNTEIVFSEWAASDPTATAKWIIDHIHTDSSASPSTLHLHIRNFKATWFHRAPVADYLKLYHTLGGDHFHQQSDYLANLKHSDDLQKILTSWDLVPPERIARLDQEIAKEKATIEKAVPDTREHTSARQSLNWARDSRARALGEIKNPLIEATINRWQEIDPGGWARSHFASKREWQ